MKKTKLLWIAAALALAAALTGCKNAGSGGAPADGGGDSGLTLPAEQDVTAVSAFTTEAAPADEDEAQDLLDLLNYQLNEANVRRTLSEIDEAVFEKAFLRQYGKTLDEWGTANGALKTASLAVNLTEADNTSALAEVWTEYNTVRITGNSSASINSSRLTIGELFGDDEDEDSAEIQVGDTLSTLESINKTINFHNTPILFPAGGGSVGKIQGIITVELKGNSDMTKTLSSFSGSQGMLEKVSAVLSITDGTKSAKFKFSFAREVSMSGRYIESTDSNIVSDIEVYNNDNIKIFTISSYGSYLDDFSYKFLNFGIGFGR